MKGKWKLIDFKDTFDLFGSGHYQVVGDGQKYNVAIIPAHWDNAKANAKHIVLCVNSHDELIEALESVLASTTCNDEVTSYAIDGPIRSQINKALSEARRE